MIYYFAFSLPFWFVGIMLFAIIVPDKIYDCVETTCKLDGDKYKTELSNNNKFYCDESLAISEDVNKDDILHKIECYSCKLIYCTFECKNRCVLSYNDITNILTRRIQFPIGFDIFFISIYFKHTIYMYMC